MLSGPLSFFFFDMAFGIVSCTTYSCMILLQHSVVNSQPCKLWKGVQSPCLTTTITESATYSDQVFCLAIQSNPIQSNFYFIFILFFKNFLWNICGESQQELLLAAHVVPFELASDNSLQFFLLFILLILNSDKSLGYQYIYINGVIILCDLYYPGNFHCLFVEAIGPIT